MRPQSSLPKMVMLGRIAWINSLAFIFLFYYLAYMQILNADAKPMTNAELFNLKIAFIVLASMSILGNVFLKRWMLNENQLNKIPSLEGRLCLFHTINLLFCMIPCILGFILATQSNEIEDFFMFATFSIIGLILNFPLQHVWQAIIERGTK